MRRLVFAFAPLLAAGCSTAEPSSPPATRGLDATRFLVRASLDLRGVRPTEVELAEVDANPERARDIADGFVEDPRFPGRVRDWFAQAFRTRIDRFALSAQEVGLSPDDDVAFQASIAEEPLMLIAHVAEQDLPFTTVVTADYTFANELLGHAFPVDYPVGARGWQKARYVDGRAAAGVLSMNSLYWRFPSNGVNYSRGRAGAIARALLCESFLDRPVDFPRDIDLSTDDAITHAVRTNQACVNCHASLDPLASHLFGFQNATESVYEMGTYHEEREQLWRSATGVGPAYFGQPSTTLLTLGQRIAADGRFVSCAVRRVYEGLLGRDVEPHDDGALTEHRESFLKGGLTLKSLVRSVLKDPAYAGLTVASREGGTAKGVTRKLLRPELLGSQMDDLTGYRMLGRGGRDLLLVAGDGLRALGGGADGTTGESPRIGPNVPLLLVHERLAEAAAAALVFHGGPRPGKVGAVLDRADLDQRPDDPAFDAAARSLVLALHRTIFSAAIAKDGDETEAALALFADVYRDERDTRAAWAGVLAALLRDPELITY